MTKPLTAEEKEQRKFDRDARKAAAAGQPEKKATKSKASKKDGAKAATKKKAKAAAAGVGHNSAAASENPAVKKLFSDFAKLDADAKAIAKAKRDIKARAKDEHNIAGKNFDHEFKLQKMDDMARVSFESGAADLKTMLGIQLSLNLAGEESEGEEHEEDDDHEGESAPAARLAAQRGANLH